MIDYLAIKKFLSSEKQINDKRFISISFVGVEAFTEEDIEIINRLLKKLPNSNFLFSRLEKNLIETLKEKIKKEDKKRIFFIYERKEYSLDSYGN